ncbi:MAG: hypothetical protein BGO29_12085 [Bacteroidales bacterium 36-12]|nr:MAG: hypothetical protein BGO29_12085 [Bacteroidales bacterium 36-12]
MPARLYYFINKLVLSVISISIIKAARTVTAFNINCSAKIMDFLKSGCMFIPATTKQDWQKPDRG